MSDLPQGWVEATLGELGSWSSGGTPSRTNPDYFGGTIPFVKTGDLRDMWLDSCEETLSELGLKNSSAKLFPAGTLLIAMYGATIGRTARLRIDAATNQACAALLEDGANQQIIDFVWKYVRSQTEQLKASGKGGAQPNISQSVLRGYPVSLPPLAEQKRIVNKLDDLSARTTAARSNLSKIEKLVERYRASVLLAAFTGKLTQELHPSENDCIEVTITDPFTHKQTAPSSWSHHLFSEVCKIIGGSQPPKANFLFQPQEGYIRLIQIRDYKSDEKATFIPMDLARRFCSKTDIMIGRYGPPIFQILRGLEGAYNVALMKAEPTDAVDREFLYWYLHHPILFRYVEIDSKRTAGQDGVNKKHLERWPILLPPLKEQREIVRRIETAFAKIDRLAEEAKKALKLVDRLDERILAKAFAGELVPQDPNDEPASVLLERIKAERATAPTKQRKRK